MGALAFRFKWGLLEAEEEVARGEAPVLSSLDVREAASTAREGEEVDF